MDQSQIVYVGEVFTEIASTVANYAKNKGKTVLYRPGVPYLRFGVERLQDTLKQASIFILNNVGWKALQESSKNPLEAPGDLLGYGPETVILTKGEEGCNVYTEKGNYVMQVPAGLRVRFEMVDPTGAGDSFSAGLIKGLLEGWALKKAISLGQVAACITCSRMGASPAFPELGEVKAASKEAF
jgi:ribokinase